MKREFKNLLDRALLPFYSYPVAGRSHANQVIFLVKKIIKRDKILHSTLTLTRILCLYMLAFLCLPVSPFVWLTSYRIFLADLSQIGTIYYLDMNLRKHSIEPNSKKEICLISKKYKTNNNFLIRMFNKHYVFVDGFVLRAFLLPFTLHPWLTRNTHKYNHPTRHYPLFKSEHPKYIYNKSAIKNEFKSLIAMRPDEVEEAEKILSRAGVNVENIITLHVRDDSFYSEKFQSARNGNIFNYEETVSAAIKKGYSVIRVGRFSDIKLDHWEEKFGHSFFDYCQSNIRCDLLDVFFCFNTTAHIGTISGISFLISPVFNKPTLYTNCATPAETLGFSKYDMTIFKKLKSIRTNKKLELAEYFEDPFDEPIGISRLQEIGLTLEENTSEEIREAFDEFITQIENRKVSPPSELHVECTKYIKKNHGSYGSVAKFSDRFLHRNFNKNL